MQIIIFMILNLRQVVSIGMALIALYKLNIIRFIHSNHVFGILKGYL